MKAGKKLYVLVNEKSTESWLTRDQARSARLPGDLYLEVNLTSKQRKKLQSIIDSLIASSIDQTIQERIIDNV